MQHIEELFVPWIHSWLNNHSDGWEYWFWTDEEANKLMESVPEVEKAYHSIENPTFKANLLKYVFVLFVLRYNNIYCQILRDTIFYMILYTTLLILVNTC